MVGKSGERRSGSADQGRLHRRSGQAGLGIDELNEELIAEKLHQDFPVAWESTEQWDKEWANDRQWS
ncbi:MAG: hypothetical protein V8T87_02685 [Victivallales bacterium]